MTNSSRPSISGRDVAGAGALMLSVNLIYAAVGAGIGALFGAVLTGAVIGFLIGFLAGIRVVAKRFNAL